MKRFLFGVTYFGFLGALASYLIRIVFKYSPIPTGDVALISIAAGVLYLVWAENEKGKP